MINIIKETVEKELAMSYSRKEVLTQELCSLNGLENKSDFIHSSMYAKEMQLLDLEHHICILELLREMAK